MNKEQKLTELQNQLDAIQEQINELKAKPKYPDSVEGIKRHWCIGRLGNILEYITHKTKYPNNLSTKERAEAFLALMQLREIHAEMIKGYIPEFLECAFTLIPKNDKNFQIIFWFNNKEEVEHFKTNPKIQELINKVKTGF